MASIQTPEQLFLYEMGSMYSAEQIILLMLPKMAQESNNDQMRQSLQMHEQQTRHHIQNLEACFQSLGQQAPKVTCYTVAGMKQEHDEFVNNNPSPNILMLFDLGSMKKVEHFEIDCYKSLIKKANLLGKNQCIPPLQQNLQEEEGMAQRVEQIEMQLTPAMVGQP
jgi:ferritin-like metal-binding protein YciE